MNINEIEAFLAVVRSGNISKASRQLFISQSTISQRIKALETKLEVRLMERSRGHTTIKLSNEGENFYKIALQWEQLMTDSKMLKEKKYIQSISIAGVDSINNFILNDIFRNIVTENPSISYFFRTHQSDEIYTLIEENAVDIGFILQERASETIVKEEFFKEELVLVINRDVEIPTVSIGSLNTNKEVYINWGHMYAMWHEKNFGYAGTLGVEVHTAELINDFLKTEEYWSIVPVSIAKELAKERSIQIVKFQKNPPVRICYLIYEKNNRKVERLYNFIIENKYLINEKLKLTKDEINYEI